MSNCSSASVLGSVGRVRGDRGLGKPGRADGGERLLDSRILG